MTITIAGVQMDIALGQVDRNLDRIRAQLARAAAQGARLVIFPECAVTGYCFRDRDEAWAVAEPIPGPATQRIQQACERSSAYAIFGMLERDGQRLFNAACLVGPQGVIAHYRKVHLPYLGVDRFAEFGDQRFQVHDLPEMRVGLNICYDASFPESARVLALEGADLVALPTNWPPGARCVAEHTIHARALENGIYCAAVNRVGVERGFEFIGLSVICDPHGQALAQADADHEQIIYAQVDPQIARQKYVVRIPDRHEIDRLADRRPEFYGPLTQPHRMPTPRQRHAPASGPDV